MKKIKWLSTKTILIITILSGIFGFIVDKSNAIEKMRTFIIDIYDKIPESFYPYIIWFLFSIIMYFVLIGARDIYFKITRRIRSDYINQTKEFADADTEFIKKIIIPKLYKDNTDELVKNLYSEDGEKLILSDLTLHKYFTEEQIKHLKGNEYVAEVVNTIVDNLIKKGKKK